MMTRLVESVRSTMSRPKLAPKRSRRRTCDHAKDSTLDIAQANLVKCALEAITTFTDAANATVPSARYWSARTWHRRKPKPITHMLMHPGLRRTRARVAARKAARDGELTNLHRCMHKRASRFTSQSYLRLNLAAPELIRAAVFKFTVILLQQFVPTLCRDTRWPLRLLSRIARGHGTGRLPQAPRKIFEIIFHFAKVICGHGTNQFLVTILRQPRFAKNFRVLPNSRSPRWGQLSLQPTLRDKSKFRILCWI